jgi:hypothetical protein
MGALRGLRPPPLRDFPFRLLALPHSPPFAVQTASVVFGTAPAYPNGVAASTPSRSRSPLSYEPNIDGASELDGLVNLSFVSVDHIPGRSTSSNRAVRKRHGDLLGIGRKSASALDSQCRPRRNPASTLQLRRTKSGRHVAAFAREPSLRRAERRIPRTTASEQLAKTCGPQARANSEFVVNQFPHRGVW